MTAEEAARAAAAEWIRSPGWLFLTPHVRINELTALILTRERAARAGALRLAGTVAALALPEAECHSRCYVLGATLCYRCQCVEAIHRALAARAEEEDRG